MERDAETRAYDAIAQHPRAVDLATVAKEFLLSAVGQRSAERNAERLSQVAAQQQLTREDAMTSFGNVLEVLERGPASEPERSLANALAASAFALEAQTGHDAEERLASELLRLAAHTPFDATRLLDRALGAAATPVWNAVAERIRRADLGALARTDRGELLVGALALASSEDERTARLASMLSAELRDPTLVRALGRRDAVQATVGPFAGEMAPPPISPLLTIVLALTGVLIALRGARLVARVVLGYRAPAEVSLSDEGGIRVRWRVEMLGRTLSERDSVLPRAGLLRVVREVRYPRFAFFAGLLALAVGSYVGVATLADGLHVASPSLLGSGLAVLAIGVAIDFVLSSAAPGARGRCRILLVPRAGATLCVSAVDPGRADALLARLAAVTDVPRSQVDR